MSEQLNHTEKAYFEDLEFQKANQEEVKGPQVSKAVKFKKTNGYSLTMSKLMTKYNCSTIEQYREVRKENKKKKPVAATKSPAAAPNKQQQKKK